MEARPPLRILVADGHPLMAEMLAQIVTADTRMELVGVSSEGAAAIEDITELNPDVAVLDLQMPHGGPDLAEEVPEGTKVLFLSCR